MALLFIDGFDHYSTSDITRKWTSNSSTTIQSTIARNSGKAMKAVFTSSASKSFTAGASWVIGAAVYVEATPTSNPITIFQLLDAGTLQCDVRINTDLTISVTRNGTALTSGTSSLTLTTATWYYIEWKVTIADSISANSCKVNVNGVNWVNVATSQDTKNTSNASANSLRIGNNLNTGSPCNVYIDDLYVCDQSGSTNNDFLGDIRVEALFPNGTGNSSAFTASGTTATWGQLTNTGSNNTALTSNNIRFISATAPFSGNVTQVQASVTTAITGKINLAIYSSVSSLPSSLLVQATELTNPGLGTATFTLQSTLAVTVGTVYWLALWANASVNLSLATNNTASTGCAQSLTYSSTFPSIAGPGGTGNTSGAYLVADLSSIPRYQLVGEATPDDDTGYVETSTTTNKDTYTMTNPSSTPGAIKGIQTVITARKTDAGARSIAAVVRSNSTDYDGATVSLGDTYSMFCEIRETDPATSPASAWTGTTVNAVEAGFKLIA